MKPNPWFVIPVLLATAAGALIGRNFARVSCLPSVSELAPVEGCTGREIVFATVGGLIAFIGVAVVSVLVIRSFREWREYQDAERERPTTGCESDQSDDTEDAG